MREVFIFACIWIALVAMSFWESYVEGRKAWDKGKLGWKINIKGFVLTAYHFYIFWVMFPVLFLLPFVVGGWDTKVFGVILSAYTSGMVLQDFMWFVVNPRVKFKEFRSKFTDYYPWIKIGKVKIIPVGYIVGIVASLLFWYFLWR